MTDAIKKLKVKFGFTYHEEKVSDTEIMFGWKPLPVDEVSIPCVVTYGSKAKSVSEEELAWSKAAGVNAASLADYRKYFKALTGDSPEDFLSKWEGSIDQLEVIRQSANPQYKEGEGSFLVSLASLLVDGKRFTKYGRIFKLISPDT